MGGIGKTTIAEEIFSQNYFEYEGWCFLACWIRNLNVGIYPYDSGCLEFKVTSLLYQNSILRLVIFLLFLYIYIHTHIRDCRFSYYWFGMKNRICFQHMKAEGFVFSIWKLRFCYLLTECCYMREVCDSGGFCGLAGPRAPSSLSSFIWIVIMIMTNCS
jgi:hypothetical protein